MLRRHKYPPRIARSVPSSVRESDPAKCSKHREWIRSLPCIVNDVSCAGRVECAHVRNGTELAGIGRKPADRYTVPMCAHHHRLQHAEGEKRFAWLFNVDLVALAKGFAARSPYLRRDEG